MAEIRQFGPEGFEAAWQDAAYKATPARDPAPSQQKYCVYNQTQERFVATDVEAVHASSHGAEARLRALEPGARTALWILPYQEISPANIRFPVDLVFLNDVFVVLDLVESFPLAGLPDSSAEAQSVLVLPAETLAEGDMCAGDRLIIDNPEEMKQHLQNLQKLKLEKAEATSSPRPFLEQFANASAEETHRSATEEPSESGVDPELAAPVQIASVAAAPVEVTPVETPPTEVTPAEIALLEHPPAEAETADGNDGGTKSPASSTPDETNSWKKRLESRNWFTSLLLGDPSDPRRAQREPLPGLIAYFFTGGTPSAHEVRDISVTGMYIITDEGWYPGTVIRVTLTDRDHPTDDRTITVNARAVRRGRDGVGLEFILDQENQQRPETAKSLEPTLGANQARIEAFLQELKKRPPQD
jgi:hypothetical protein